MPKKYSPNSYFFLELVSNNEWIELCWSRLSVMQLGYIVCRFSYMDDRFWSVYNGANRAEALVIRSILRVERVV